MRLTKAQHERDSMILGAILAGASVKPLLPADNGGEFAAEREKDVCAIGAGNIGRKVNKPSAILKTGGMYENTSHNKIPIKDFATANEVTVDYACGVNDGFEEEPKASKAFFSQVNQESLDYLRGWHVGQAARIESGY